MDSPVPAKIGERHEFPLAGGASRYCRDQVSWLAGRMSYRLPNTRPSVWDRHWIAANAEKRRMGASNELRARPQPHDA